MTTDVVNVADLTLERVRRLEADFKAFRAETLSWQTEMRQIILANISFTQALEADVRGAIALYQAHETRFDRVESKLDRILARLEIND